MNRYVSITLLVLVLAPLIFASACTAESSRDVKLAPVSALPTQMQNAPTTVREAYQFALANPDVMKNIPCYCGCGSIGHTSNYMCYIKQTNANGTFVFDDHALGCSICVDITRDAMRLMREGKSQADIRANIVATYSQFGPPNQ